MVGFLFDKLDDAVMSGFEDRKSLGLSPLARRLRDSAEPQDRLSIA